MNSFFKSTIRRSNTVNLGSCVGLGENMIAHRQSFNNHDHLPLSHYILKNFFDGDNYRSIIECLDGGYDVAMDLIQFMQDYRDLLREHAQSLLSFFNKCKSRLKQQQTISSYHTTKYAQIQTINTSEELAKFIETRCDGILKVMNDYRKQIDKMYPKERYRNVHKHYRTDEIKKLFKTAQSNLRQISKNLEELREKEKTAKSALHNANVQCENLSLDPATSKKKQTNADNHQKEKECELESIKKDIAQSEEEEKQEKIIYREKAINIFRQCQEYEQKRLDQIQQTLIAFIDAIHPSEYSDKLDSLYENLLLNIEKQTNSSIDLEFWAQTYGINNLNKSISSETNDNQVTTVSRCTTESRTTNQNTTKSQKNETENLTTTKKDKHQSLTEIDEDEEEQTVAVITTAKTKGKKNKTTTGADKKNSISTDPTTPNATGLDQV